MECTTSVSEIGSDFFDKSLFEISYFDTVSIKVSTVLGDTIATSNASRLLVGYHQDERLGSVTAKSIFQIGITHPVVLDKFNTDYISLKLFFKRDKYSYYDTTQEQTFSVYQLKQSLRLFNGYLYNSSKFSIYEKSLGSVTFLPNPRRGDSLEVALPDSIGRQLMQMAYEGDYRLATNADFQQFIKGFAILPDTTNSRSVMGFTLKPEMRLYYLDRSTLPSTIQHVSFGLNNNIFFNNIHSWRDGSSVAPLKKIGDMVSSIETNNEGYFQSGVGLQMRIEMPYLRNLLADDRGFVFNKAILEIMPIVGSYKQDPLPTVLSVYAVNEHNFLISNAAQAARLIKDTDLGRNTHYTADITSFVNSQIQNDAINKNALLVLLDDATFRSTVNRLYVGDQRNFYNMKLKLYYLTLSNQSN